MNSQLKAKQYRQHFLSTCPATLLHCKLNSVIACITICFASCGNVAQSWTPDYFAKLVATTCNTGGNAHIFQVAVQQCCMTSWKIMLPLPPYYFTFSRCCFKTCLTLSSQLKVCLVFYLLPVETFYVLKFLLSNLHIVKTKTGFKTLKLPFVFKMAEFRHSAATVLSHIYVIELDKLMHLCDPFSVNVHVKVQAFIYVSRVAFVDI